MSYTTGAAGTIFSEIKCMHVFVYISYGKQLPPISKLKKKVSP